jgi:hypothetical protein
MTAQELDRSLSGKLERSFGSRRDDGLAQRETRHAGFLLSVSVRLH